MMNVSEGEDDKTFLDEYEDRRDEQSGYLRLTAKQRDCLIKRLSTYGLPTREIVQLTGMSSRSVARTLQRLGLKRKKFEMLIFFTLKKTSCSLFKEGLDRVLYPE